MRQAFENNPEELFVKETLVIALMECDLQEEAERQLHQFEEEGTEFDEEFNAFRAGKVSLYEYYVSP